MNIQQCYYPRSFRQIDLSSLTLVIVVDLANMTFLYLSFLSHNTFDLKQTYLTSAYKCVKNQIFPLFN